MSKYDEQFANAVNANDETELEVGVIYHGPDDNFIQALMPTWCPTTDTLENASEALSARQGTFLEDFNLLGINTCRGFHDGERQHAPHMRLDMMIGVFQTEVHVSLN